MLLSVQESPARKRIGNGSKVQVIFGDRIKLLFIPEDSDHIPVLAAVNTEEKTTPPGRKLRDHCCIGLRCQG